MVGAGVIGLTTAHVLAEQGFDVTIFAREFPAESRSARATGVWSPSSRIALANFVDPAFEQRWESWARQSWARHQTYIGRPGVPVEFVRQYDVSDQDRGPRIPSSRDFLHLARSIRNIEPGWTAVAPEASPFPGKRTYAGFDLVFNIAAYSDCLLRDYLGMGGKIIRRTFNDYLEILALQESVIVNCTGYDARSLWSDATVTPIRGQISWYIPQPEARYGVTYQNVFALSRTDGVIVQYLGANEDWGYGDDREMPDREETQNASECLMALFA